MNDLLKKVGFYSSVLVVGFVLLSPERAEAKTISGESLSFAKEVVCGALYSEIQMYSSSWGPSDDGRISEGPGRFE